MWPYFYEEFCIVNTRNDILDGVVIAGSLESIREALCTVYTVRQNFVMTEFQYEITAASSISIVSTPETGHLFFQELGSKEKLPCIHLQYPPAWW